jgi:hypothetical protein
VYCTPHRTAPVRRGAAPRARTHARRYNLLREHNEGYGKLLTLLLSGGPLAPEHAPSLAQQVAALIGTFSLDPNRCGCALVCVCVCVRARALVCARVGVCALVCVCLRWSACVFGHCQQLLCHVAALQQCGKWPDPLCCNTDSSCVCVCVSLFLWNAQGV